MPWLSGLATGNDGRCSAAAKAARPSQAAAALISRRDWRVGEMTVFMEMTLLRDEVEWTVLVRSGCRSSAILRRVTLSLQSVGHCAFRIAPVAPERRGDRR